MNKQILASLQWTVFILAGTIVAPISIAFAFGLPHEETTTLLQRTFFVMGLTSILQGMFGHKLPLMEGPAGLWWGVFLTYASMAATGQQSVYHILSELEFGMLISGAFFIVLSLLKLLDVVKKLFTPTITGIYLILLVMQLSGPFLKGIMNLQSSNSSINWLVTLCAGLTIVLSIILARSSFRFFKSYSVIISLIFGWVLFLIFGLNHFSAMNVGSIFSLPQILAWGRPSFDLGITMTSILTAMLLLTNLIASSDAVERVVQPKHSIHLNRTGLVMGINQAFSGLFPTVGGVPIAGSAGFILTTGIKERTPFLIGSLIILMISFFPPIMAIFAALPAAVGYATLFVPIASILGLGLQSLKKAIDQEEKLFIVSIAMMSGTGMMFLPTEALQKLPSLLNSLLSNGLVIGVLVGIFIEQFLMIQKHKKEKHAN